MPLPEFIEKTHAFYNGNDYTIYSLKPDSIPDDDLENRMYRSAIFTTDEKRLLCIAPSKSLPALRETSGSLEVTEIIEGTMINLFWNGEKWEIATKKRIGGNNFYFRNEYGTEGEPPRKTFREMFFDAIGKTELSDFPFSRSFCYSFVLQHPCNHIVLPIITPQLYLVATYELDGTTCDYRSPRNHPQIDQIRAMNIKIPRHYDFFMPAAGKPLSNDSFVDAPNRYTYDFIVSRKLDKLMENPENSHLVPGLMVVDLMTGILRTKIQNSRYLHVKELRGNNPNLHYHYLALRKTHQRVAEFLHFFPMYKPHFDHFATHFEAFRRSVRGLYWEIYVKKSKTLDSIDNPFKFFVKKLQYDVFLPKHKENKKFYITEEEVEKFLDRPDIMIPF